MRRAVGLLAVATSLVLVTGAVPTDREPRSGAGQGSRAMPAPGPDVSVAHEVAVVPHTARARPDRTAVLPATHTVAPGDTLVGVAERYAVGAAELARVNAVDGQATLRPGQLLVLPRSGPPQPATPEEAMAANLAVEGLLEETAAAYGLDRALVQAVAWRESRWEQRVVSHRDAIGVMQVLPSTGAAMARHLDREVDLYEVTDNVEAGTAYLAVLLDRYSGDVEAALAAYHQGPRALAERGPIPASQRYVADVLELRTRFAQAPAAR